MLAVLAVRKRKRTGVHDERKHVFVQVTCDNIGLEYPGRIWIELRRRRTLSSELLDDWVIHGDWLPLYLISFLHRSNFAVRGVCKCLPP
jgi:hypothetical protein